MLLNIVLSREVASQNTWSWQNPLPQGNRLESVYFVNDQTGWAVGYKGTIMHTADGGTTWIQQSSGTTNDLFGVHFESPTLGYVVGLNATILKTIDAGATWSPLTSSIPSTTPLYSVFFISSVRLKI